MLGSGNKIRQRPRGGILDPAFGFNFLWKDEEDNFGLGWVGTMILAMMRNFDDMFSRSRMNPACCLLRRIDLVERRAAGGSAPGQDGRAAKHPDSCAHFEFRVGG